jgi:hypothetical protein
MIYVLLTFLLLHLSGCFTANLLPEKDYGIEYPSPWSDSLSRAEFIKDVKAEVLSIKESQKALKKINSWLRENKTFLKIDGGKTLSPDTKILLLPVWQSYLDHFYRLEGLRIKHSSYWKINGVMEPVAHALSFFAFNSSFLVQNAEGSRFIEIMSECHRTEEWLEEPNDLFPKFAYSRLKYRVLNFLTFDDISAQSAYFRNSLLPVVDTMSDTVVYWAERLQKTLPDTLLSWAASENIKRTGKNGVDIAKKQLFSFFFPLQKGLADFLGRVYYNPFKKSKYITSAQADSLEKLLLPGDLILVRSNYVASNIGLPGFWPHIAIYTGKNSENDNSVIEALANGTVYRSFKKTAYADYLAVLRPRLSVKDKETAVNSALKYVGVPYDFDFDFDTDATLVCSEVVYKSFQARAEMEKGLSLPLVSILGRWTLPPNDIAALYALEKENPQFDFVAFIDHRPKSNESFFSTDSAFLTTPSRVKWDFLLE